MSFVCEKTLPNGSKCMEPAATKNYSPGGMAKVYRCYDHPVDNPKWNSHTLESAPNPNKNFTPTRGPRPIP